MEAEDTRAGSPAAPDDQAGAEVSNCWTLLLGATYAVGLVTALEGFLDPLAPDFPTGHIVFTLTPPLALGLFTGRWHALLLAFVPAAAAVLAGENPFFFLVLGAPFMAGAVALGVASSAWHDAGSGANPTAKRRALPSAAEWC